MAINARSLCTLYDLRRADNTSCMPTMPGTGDRIYAFDIDLLFGDAVPEPLTADKLTADSTAVETYAGFYDHATFVAKLSTAKLIAIDIKADSGQVTSEKSEDTEGRSLVGTAIIDHSIEEFLKTDEAMAFRNMGALFPDGNGSYYVIMSPYTRTKYSCNYDSGTTYDSDHGFTITFTASPVFFGCPKVTLTDTEIKNNTVSTGTAIAYGT